MSNEVNQAFLRAYVKNRAEVALQTGTRNAPGAQRPNRAETSQSNAAETASMRIDSASPSAQPQRVTRSGQTIPAPHLIRPASSAAPAPSPAPTSDSSIRGVWSPIGVERGMKGINIGANGPATVVNAGQPIAPSTNATRLNSTTIQPQPQEPVAHAPRQPEEPAFQRTTTHIRLDAGHTVARQAHLSPSQRPTAPDPTSTAEAHPSPVPTKTPSFDIRTTRHVVHGAHPVTSPAASPQPSTVERPRNNVRPPVPQLGRQPDTRRDEVAYGAKKPTLPLPVSFAPSWEVDQFFWPEVLLQIEKSDQEAFQLVAKHLRLANQDGLKVMAITSGERGVGRSTVAMHMARCAASSGMNVALIDADGCYPSLIDQLRIDANHGWQDCLFENIPLEEVAVKSLVDNITFFPLTSIIPTQQLHANLHRMAKVIKRISTAFDMVFLDSNRLNLEQRDLIGVSQDSVIDAAIVVTDSELSIKEKVDTAISILQGMGIASIGVVQNFHG
jgi:Mrp family chromosome partitioning ATPase